MQFFSSQVDEGFSSRIFRYPSVCNKDRCGPHQGYLMQRRLRLSHQFALLMRGDSSGVVIHLHLGPCTTSIDRVQLMSRFPLLQGQLAESAIAEQGNNA
jgi:hypothetical protein